MTEIHKRAAEAIKMAIQMEKDGRAFYEEAARKTTSKLGKEIFESLAKDEIKHLHTFQKMFEAMTGEGDWKAEVDKYTSQVRKAPIFQDSAEKAGEADPNDVEAIRLAMDKERGGIEYYGKLAEETGDDLARELFTRIKDEEVYHYDLLQLQYDSLTGAGVWYDMSEFQMDGMY